MFLSSLDGDLGILLELQQGSRASPQVAAETQVSSLVLAGNSGFAGELPERLRPPLKVQREICFSGFAAQDTGLHWSRGGEARVLLELGWYSGFLATCSCCPVEFSWGDSSLARICRVAPILLQ